MRLQQPLGGCQLLLFCRLGKRTRQIQDSHSNVQEHLPLKLF